MGHPITSLHCALCLSRYSSHRAMLYRSWCQNAGGFRGTISHRAPENSDLANAVVGFQRFVWSNGGANVLAYGTEQPHLGRAAGSVTVLCAEQTPFEAEQTSVGRRFRSKFLDFAGNSCFLCACNGYGRTAATTVGLIDRTAQGQTGGLARQRH